MKIKTKLIVSFCIILFVPILLTWITLYGFSAIQMKALSRTYGIPENNTYLFTNALQLLNRLTQEDYAELQQTALMDPGKLVDTEYLGEIQLSLDTKYSYLVVVADNELVYNGDEDFPDVCSVLPGYGCGIKADTGSAYVDHDDELLIKQIDFYTPDNQKASLYILTTTQSMVPAIRSMIFQLIAAIIIILILTAVLLIGWLYSSMVSPLKKLTAAAENIQSGNLDFEVEIIGKDEIGDLCLAFERMRARLKFNAEEKLASEKENRDLISNIVHDLKTPITSVKGYSEGILDGVANTPEKVEKYVRTIYNKANEMNTLINELTLYTKLDTNGVPYNFEKLNVAGYFEETTIELGMDLEEKNIELTYRNYTDPATTIIADPEQLRRVINNIVGNSVKYMGKDHGQIRFEIKDAGDHIQVEIEDDGQGIEQKDLSYIFDRFYRADASRNSEVGGSGIGLSIVKKIIEDHGGKIWAKSRVGEGTCMTFVIRKYQEDDK